MPQTLKRYQYVALGHSEQTIQDALDRIPVNQTIEGIFTVGVNVFAIMHDTRIDGYITYEEVIENAMEGKKMRDDLKKKSRGA